MRARRNSSEAGFTLIETLLATALFLLVIGALATVTAQWLPSWNHGFARVQRSEHLALGLERIMADLAGAWQALSFIGLGLVLVGIGYLYQRLLFPRRLPAAP